MADVKKTSDTNIDARVMRLFDGYVHGEMGRREFLRRTANITASMAVATSILGSLSPDYALAQQVDPSDKSLSVGYKKYASPQGAGVMNGYYARPRVVQHKLPAIVVIHENRGLNPYIEDVARRLAVAGFIAFAPDALTPLGGYPGNDDDGRTLQRQRDRDEMLQDFVAAADFLHAHPDSSGDVGAVGFCYGGSVAMQLASKVPHLGAAVAFYGRHPIDTVEAIAAPLLLHHGSLDERVNAGWPAFESALTDAGKAFENHLYEGAGHGFHNDTTPRFDADAAELAWSRTVKFFTHHLKLSG